MPKISYLTRNYIPIQVWLLNESKLEPPLELIGKVCATNEANQNISWDYKELDRGNFNMGHVGLINLQWMGCSGIPKTNNKELLTNFEVLNVSFCAYGKLFQRS